MYIIENSLEKFVLNKKNPTNKGSIFLIGISLFFQIRINFFFFVSDEKLLQRSKKEKRKSPNINTKMLQKM